MLKYLLNTNGGNTKILKSEKGTDYKIASLSMRPDIILCPSQIIAECKKDCLVSAGRGAMSSIENIRQAKTDFFHNDKKAFLELLLKEIDKFRLKCKRAGFRAAYRLNTISDVNWSKYIDFSLFGDCLFYAYR